MEPVQEAILFLNILRFKSLRSMAKCTVQFPPMYLDDNGFILKLKYFYTDKLLHRMSSEGVIHKGHSVNGALLEMGNAEASQCSTSEPHSSDSVIWDCMEIPGGG